MKRSVRFFGGVILVVGMILTMALGVAYAQTPEGKVLPHQQPDGGGGDVGIAAWSTFDNPNYYYADVTSAPSGTYYRQAGFSPDGTKIVAQKNWGDGTYLGYEIVLMDADGSDETVISAGDSGTGDIFGYMNPFWSDDGTAVGFAEVHNANPNKIIRYDLATSTRTYIYEPVAPDDVNNPDFLGNSKTAIVFWAYGPAGGADLFTWDGSTLTNLTNTADYKEYEPVSNADGTVILYWSGETTAEPVNTTHTLTYSGGTWTKDVGFTPIADSYWSAWTTPAATQVAVTVMSTKDVHLYDNTGAFVADLTGPGYSGGSGQWNFVGYMPQAANGELVLTSNAGRGAVAGRDIVIAAPRAAMYVDDDGSDSNPGTEAAPFATIQKAIDTVYGSTVYVADGTYTATSLDSIVIAKDGLELIGESRDGTIIDAGAWGTSGTGWPRGIQVKASSVTIKNFTVQGFTGDEVNTGGYGIVFRDWDHDYPPETLIYYTGGTVENVKLQNNYSPLYALVQSYLTVNNCLIQNNSADGMFIARWSDHATITGNTVANSGNHGIWVGKDWNGYGPSGNATITGNTVNGAVEGGITFEASDTATISNNDVSNVTGGGWSVGAISLKDGVSNVNVSNNVVHDNSSASCPSGYEPCTGNGIGVDGASSNVTVSNNSIYGNSGYGLYSKTSTVNASGNWWGSADPATVKAAANGGTKVDYTPWLAAGTDTGDPGFQGDFSTLWVDDDSPQTGTTGRIQEGINLVSGSTVNVAAGLYVEDISISKALTLLGPKSAVARNTGSELDWTSSKTAAWTATEATAAGEAVIRSAAVVLDKAVVTIAEDYNVTLKGFVIEARNRTDGTNAHLIYVKGQNTTIQSITIENNIIGPITGDAQDGNKGRFGIAFDSQSGGPNGLAGSVKGNKILGAEGNGANVFIIGSHYKPSMSDYSGMKIEYNDVYGANRSGMELVGGLKGLTVQFNTVIYNGYIWNGSGYVQSSRSAADPNNILFGAGINLIRSGTICGVTPENQNAIEDLKLFSNIISHNEKSGVYVDAQQRNLAISSNLIIDNGRDGIWLDEFGTYNESKAYNEAYGYLQNATVTNNVISGSAAPYAAVRVTGKPPALAIHSNNLSGNDTGALQEDGVGQTWDYTADATCNWWGSAVAADVQAMISGDVDALPYLMDGTDIAPASRGFQPGGACTGGPVKVYSDLAETILVDTYFAIQPAIDDATTLAGYVVRVTAGTYAEYVAVNKSLNLRGSPGASIQKPAGYVYYKLPDEGTTKSFRPIVLAYGGSITGGDGTTAATAYTIQGAGTVNVTITGFDIDGLNAWTGATSSNFADAILLRNVVGTVSSNAIHDMLPADTNQLTLGIEVRGDNSVVTISGNTLTEFGKVGMLVAGNLGTPVATITGNTVTAVYYGPYVTNGIEINYRATGTVSNNTVTGATGAGTIWSGACIMVTDADNVSITENDVSVCEIGISVGGRANYGYVARNNVIVANTIADCVYSSVEINTNSQNTTIRNNTITGVAARGGTEEAGIVVLEYSNAASGYPNGVLIEGNSISGDPGFWGIDIYRNADNVTIQNNIITGGAVGIALELKEANSVGKTLTIGGATGKANSITGQTVLAVSTGPYNYSGVIYQWTPDANASGNWWGTNTPAGVAALVSANVDYTPWLAAGTDTDLVTAGFQGDFSTLWVDDDSAQTGTTGRIQEGINLVSGSTVYVAAGEYPETVNVESKTDLNVIGQDKATTIIKPTTTLPWDVAGSTRRAVVRVVSSTDIDFSNLTFDFDLVKGNDVIGVFYWDSTGVLNNNVLKNMSAPDASGYYTEIGSYIRAPSYTAGARAQVTFQSNTFINTGRVGIVMHDFVNATISDNTFYKDIADFGYAMEIGSESTATVSGNTIYGYDTPAATDQSESAGIYIENSFTGPAFGTPVMGVTKNVSVTGNEIYDSQWAVVIGNEWDDYAGDVDIVVTLTGNDFHDNVNGAVKVADEDKEHGSSVTVTAASNTLTDNGDVGYFFYTSGDGDITVSIDDDTISGHDVGMYLNDYATGTSGSSYDVAIHNSAITGNTSFGVQNEYSGTTIDAEHNWWGCPCGPSGEGPGCGDAVSTYVDYSPWWSDAAMTIEGPIAGANLTIPTGATTEEAQGVLDCAGPNSTVTFESGSYQGPLYLNNDGITLKLNGCSIGAPGPAFNIVGDDEVIQGPGKIDGGGGGGAGILVMGGAGNFILEGVQVTGWANGVELAGSVTSFKLVNNWIHSNTANGLLIDTGVTLDGIVTIEGNLFKVNGGNGIQHNGTGTLPAEYNSWGDIGGPASGDGVGGSVDTDPFTYFESFFDVYPDTLALERHVMEATSFDVALKADAVNVYGLTFKFTYDTAKLTLNSTTFSAPWAGQCVALPGAPVGTVYYYCGLYNPTPEWTATAATIATFNFTAFTGTPGNGPWEALFDLSHVEVDTSAAAIGGRKVFVNNAGFNDPSAPDRDITDTNDGKIFIERGANYTGLVDLQGRANDSGATIKIYSGALKTSTLLAQGSTNSAGAYTTSWVVPQWLGVNYTYYMVVDRYLYLPTTVMGGDLHPLPLEWAHNKLLDMYPLTMLAKVKLLGGDATNDDDVDIFDLSCIGGDYALAPDLCGVDGTSDVTGDGLVDILDLSLSAGNYYLDASPWTP